MDNLTQILVAVIGGLATVSAAYAGLNIRKVRTEQRQFKDENSEQHGATMALVREIELNTRETKQDVRELKLDVDVLRHDLHEHIGEPPKKKAAPRKTAPKK
jgi:hypothetical protein